MTSFDYSSKKKTTENPASRFFNRVADALKLPKKARVRRQYFIGTIVLLLVLVGGSIAFFLAQSNQDLRNQAASNPYTGSCTTSSQCASGYTCQNNRCTPNCTSNSGRPNGCTCNNNSQCNSGRCGIDPADNSPACMPATGSPTPSPSSLPVNATCTQSSQCQSGLCRNSRCANPENSNICTVNHPTYQAARGGCVVRL
jgi:hypothetical protein